MTKRVESTKCYPVSCLPRPPNRLDAFVLNGIEHNRDNVKGFMLCTDL
jgi:hypothetical protein